MNKVSKKRYNRLVHAIVLILALFSVGCGVEISENGESGYLVDSSSESADEQGRGAVGEMDSDQSESSNSDNNSVEDMFENLSENDITIGIIKNAHGWKKIKEDANSFNAAQSQYKIIVVEYESYNSLITDIVRKQGADIFSLWDMPVEMLTQKGVLEDLTPYFEGSEIVSLENLTSAVSRACTIEGKMSCLIPSFAFQAIVTQTGVADNGKWTVEDYMAFAEKYPGGMLNSNIKQPVNLFLNDLALVPEMYVNWEEGVCKFDGDSFVAFLEKLKKYSNTKYDISPSGTLAERLYRREYLTMQITLYMNSDMSDYLNLKEVLGSEFEVVGFPSSDDTLQYRMVYDKMYGMNAATEKKEGAWAFFEYLLSQDVQKEIASAQFPARQDVLEAVLQEIVDFEVPEHYKYNAYNPYTEENVTEYRPFTEEDGQVVLEMLDRVYRFSVMGTTDIYDILVDELKYYFEGTKSAKEVAGLIQNRIQLYLDENSK